MKERDAPSEPQLAPIICGESYERRILMTDGELIKKLREELEFNPWLGKADEFRSNFQNGVREFVLDQTKVDEYETMVGKMEGDADCYHLRLDIPPQPFIGTPTAGVWLLLKNPGFSEIV